jgi:hypothetical protein
MAKQRDAHEKKQGQQEPDYLWVGRRKFKRLPQPIEDLIALAASFGKCYGRRILRAMRECSWGVAAADSRKGEDELVQYVMECMHLRAAEPDARAVVIELCHYHPQARPELIERAIRRLTAMGCS